jgi:hypothetical protein
MTLHEQMAAHTGARTGGKEPSAWVRNSAIQWRKLLILHRDALSHAWCKVFPRHDFGTARVRFEHSAGNKYWRKVAQDAWSHPGWAKAAREYHQARGDRILVVETEPERLARLRPLMNDNVSIERAWNEINDPRSRRTPQVTVEAIWQAVREHGLDALKRASQPAAIEDLRCCRSNRARKADRISQGRRAEDWGDRAMRRYPGDQIDLAKRLVQQTPGATPDARLISRCAADIVPKRIDFLWSGRIARGKHTAIAGEPGDGKSQLSVYVAATISRGGEWPCGEGRAPVGNVIILNAEDGADDTVVPRLIAAGADLKRVHIVSAVMQEGGNGRRAFNLQADLALLEEKIAEIGDVALVIIDPISSYMGKADSHKNTDVRGALEPASEMADRLKVAILSITHFSKSGAGNNSKALHRFIGSIAFVDAPRAAFAVIEDSENEGRILFLHAKNNMAPKPQGLAYRLVQMLVKGDGEQEIVASYIAWDSAPVVMSADEALRATESSGDRTAATEAEDFLLDKLAAGPVAAKEGEEHARAIGISRRTLERARKKLGVIAEKAGLKDGWTWRLPPEDRQIPPKTAKENNGSLRPNLAVFDAPSQPSPMSEPADDYPIMPEFLRRSPLDQPQANGRAPALGPPGDSLDDFK